MKLLLCHGQLVHRLERSGMEVERLNPNPPATSDCIGSHRQRMPGNSTEAQRSADRAHDASAPDAKQLCSSPDRRFAIIRKMTPAKFPLQPLLAPLMAVFVSLV